MTLTGITWDHPRGYDPLVASSRQYQRYFDIRIKWEKRSLTKFGDQSLIQLAESYDLLIIDHPHIGMAEATKCLVPFDDIIPASRLSILKNQSAGPSFCSYNYRGKQWALPIDAAVQCAAYRPDLIAKLPIPKNWDEVFDLADTVKKKGLKLAIPLCPSDSLCTFLTLTAQFGSPIREGNENLVNTEVGLMSLKLMGRMKEQFHECSIDCNPIQLFDYMSTNNDIVYTPLAFCYTNYARDFFRSKRLSYSDAPGINNALLGGAGIAISAKSKYKKEAAEYATWVCGAEFQNSFYVLRGGQPANNVAWSDEFANWLTNDFFYGIAKTLEQAFVRPRYNGWPAFQKYMGEVIHRYLQEDSDPRIVLSLLQLAYKQSYKTITTF